MLIIMPLLIMHEYEQKICSSELPKLYLPNFILSEMGLHWPCVIRGVVSFRIDDLKHRKAYLRHLEPASPSK